jgi:hypothetical protein
MYPQPVLAGTRVDIVYHPVTRRIDDANYTGRLYIQLPGENVKPAGLQYPPPGAAPLIPNDKIWFGVRVVNADTGEETGKDYEIAEDQIPDTPELATWNFTDTGRRAGGTVEFKFQSVARQRDQASNYDALINGQYDNKILSLQQVAGQYVNINGSNLMLNTTMRIMQWRLVVGTWNSRAPNINRQIFGYWIYSSGTNMCWKLDHDYRSGSGLYTDGLTLWNADGKALGTPQDYELFNFVAKDQTSLTVNIKHAFGVYVGLNNETLTCNAALPADFVVNFLS